MMQVTFGFNPGKGVASCEVGISEVFQKILDKAAKGGADPKVIKKRMEDATTKLSEELTNIMAEVIAAGVKFEVGEDVELSVRRASEEEEEDFNKDDREDTDN